MVAIHQIWIDFNVFTQHDALHHVFVATDLPAKYKKCIESWRALSDAGDSRKNSYTLWTTRTTARFLRDCAPQFLQIYWALPFAVMRTDLLRLLILYYFGGVYADIDVEIRHGQGAHASALLNALEPGVDVLLSPIRCLGNGASPLWIPNNDLIAVAAPRHAFLTRVLQLYCLQVRDSTVARTLADVSEIAKTYYVASLGPLLLHKVYRQFSSTTAAAAAAAAATPSTRFLIFPKVRIANTMLAPPTATATAAGAASGLDVFIDCSDGTWFSGTSWFSFNRFVVEFAVVVILAAALIAALVASARILKRRGARASTPL